MYLPGFLGRPASIMGRWRRLATRKSGQTFQAMSRSRSFTRLKRTGSSKRTESDGRQRIIHWMQTLSSCGERQEQCDPIPIATMTRSPAGLPALETSLMGERVLWQPDGDYGFRVEFCLNQDLTGNARRNGGKRHPSDTE